MKTDPMAFILGMVGGLLLLISVGMTSFILASTEKFMNIFTSGLIISAAVPMFVMGILILAFGRVIDLLNEINNKR